MARVLATVIICGRDTNENMVIDRDINHLFVFSCTARSVEVQGHPPGPDPEHKFFTRIPQQCMNLTDLKSGPSTKRPLTKMPLS
jgi:hypothetical protein